ncbi:MAG: cysteine peptidase family C39 domain-containing protein [Bacteroidaceae bacterium]|nr:cysteine peptidase family C39 domain-containing protein [Bacteroidaceae bacterium]
MHISKFPHYHQQESADCGPACLRMIAKASYKMHKNPKKK